MEKNVYNLAINAGVKRIPCKVNHPVSSWLCKEVDKEHAQGRLSCLWFEFRPASLKSASETGDALSWV